MKILIILAVISFAALSEALPPAPVVTESHYLQPVVRIARTPAAELQPAEKDLEGSETAYAVYPYYHYPYYYRYPYYIYGR